MMAGAAAFVPHARAADLPRFTLGVASGSPTAGSVVLWTHVAGDDLGAEVPVQWELAHDEAFSRIAARGSEAALASDAHTVHAEVRGLEPARGYWYRFTALGHRSMPGFTRTAPAPGDAVKRLDFSIASCQRYEHGHYAAWRDVAQAPPELVLFLGDYIYEYATNPNALRTVRGGRTEDLAAYRQRYVDYKSDPHLQAAHAAAPWLIIWDDHEVENDYAGLLGERRQPNFEQQRAAAYRAWWEHLPLPKSMRPVGPELRVYGSLDWGRLARIHLLDDRQYRDAQVCPRPGRPGGSAYPLLKDCPQLRQPQRTLLGADQERWLAGNWSAGHRWNLLAQQTLMARQSRTPPVENGEPAGQYWTDGWDGYAGARERLLRTLHEKRVSGPVVLGGDVHSNFVADLLLDFDDPKSAIVASEFCGTSISSNGGAQQLVDATLPHNPHIHHGRADERGTVRFTLDEEKLQAELRIVDDVKREDSSVRAGARFVVDARRPGIQRA